MDEHQDDVKQWRKFSPVEKMNSEGDEESKNAMIQTIEYRKNHPLTFTLSSPVVLATENIALAYVNYIKKTMHCILSWSCLSKKLNVSTVSDIDLKLRKRVVEQLPARLSIYLS